MYFSPSGGKESSMSGQGRRPKGPDERARRTKAGARITLAERVIEGRTREGLKQEDLSRQVGLGRHGVFRIEKAIMDPRLSTIEALAEALETTPARLLR